MRTPVAIIGGGPAGLAMSHALAQRAIDHVVLERGEVAHAWKTERWDSLRLLTPNWMTRLPGFAYDGDEPDGYMTAAEVVAALARYRESFTPPVLTHTPVTAVRPAPGGFTVTTEQGPVAAQVVVVATGANGTPRVPGVAARLPDHLAQLHAARYRRPAQLGAGPALVVGASASGVQIADELQRSGRAVTIAVGEHVRLPRRYRGRDIYWWMDALGLLEEQPADPDELTRARRSPSSQLAGTPERRSLGLPELQRAGVRLVGRLVGAVEDQAQFSGSLAHLVRSADLKQQRLLDRIDAAVAERGWDDHLPAPERPEPTSIPAAPTTLHWREFESVVWATGYRPQYPWLDPALLDRHGQIRHEGGVMAPAGMYVLGLRHLRRRSSTLIYGIERDARELSEQVAGHLDALARAA